jgi:hypothetical protein
MEFIMRAALASLVLAALPTTSLAATAVAPWADVAGTWYGIILDPGPPASSWATTMTLADDAAVGDVIGTISYTVIESGRFCSGELRRFTEVGDAFWAEEIITVDPTALCAPSGYWEMIPNPDGTLAMSYGPSFFAPPTWSFGQSFSRVAAPTSVPALPVPFLVALAGALGAAGVRGSRRDD